MLARFCLYGFLKNQRYFEPFLVLALLEKGLDFAAIGVLITIREVAVLLLEVPSGACADVFGRRRSLGLSFLAYAASFTMLGLAEGFPALAAGMLLFAVGEAFRTGTHKALIFRWLEHQGRLDERTRIYGLTRSWSKIGSAVSSLFAAGFVLWGGSYAIVFFASVVPCLIDAVNVLGYPSELDPPISRQDRIRRSARLVWDSAKASWQRRSLRRRLIESMGFEGSFHATKDYLQPVLQALALGVVAGVTLEPDGDPRAVALWTAPVYFALFLIAAVASRQAHRVVKLAGSEAGAARWSWLGSAGAFAAILSGVLLAQPWLAILGFVFLHAVQNVWRPVLVSRIDAARPDDDSGATILSLESQSRRIAVAVLAPALGLAIDAVRAGAFGPPLWPVGVAGLAITLAFACSSRRNAD